MYKIIILLLVTGCGASVKHTVSGGIAVSAPTNYTVTFVVPETTFEVTCTKKYKDVANSSDRDDLIQQCMTQNQAIVEQLINTLNGVGNVKSK